MTFTAGKYLKSLPLSVILYLSMASVSMSTWRHMTWQYIAIVTKLQQNVNTFVTIQC